MLLQSMVSTIPNGHRVFGFIAIVAMACDAAVIMALSAVLDSVESLRGALYICAFVFVGHGALEVLLGPWLVLRGAHINHNNRHQQQYDDEGRLFDENRSAATDVRGSYVPYEDLGDAFGGGGGGGAPAASGEQSAEVPMRTITDGRADYAGRDDAKKGRRRSVIFTRRGGRSGVAVSPQQVLEDE